MLSRPGLRVILFIGALCALLLVGTGHASQSSAPPPLDTLHAVTQQIFELTNAERSSAGRGPLLPDSGLHEVACHHTRDMIVRDFMGHVNPDGVGPDARAARHHRQLIGASGENVLSRVGRKEQTARALAKELVKNWMESPGHRKNILRRAYSHLGVCVMQDGDQMRATQTFARIRGRVEPPLPARVSAGSRVPMTVTPVPRRRLTATKYDLWSPTEERRVVGPRALAGTLYVPDTTGTFRVRFYFPRSNRYAVHYGPALTVEQAAKAAPSTAQH